MAYVLWGEDSYTTSYVLWGRTHIPFHSFVPSLFGPCVSNKVIATIRNQNQIDIWGLENFTPLYRCSVISSLNSFSNYKMFLLSKHIYGPGKFSHNSNLSPKKRVSQIHDCCLFCNANQRVNPLRPLLHSGYNQMKISPHSLRGRLTRSQITRYCWHATRWKTEFNSSFWNWCENQSSIWYAASTAVLTCKHCRYYIHLYVCIPA